jgi:cytoskeleton protein RodZ
MKKEPSMSDRSPVRDGQANPESVVAALNDSQCATLPGPTAGALLREAREAAGIHVAVLAALLKVPEQKLEALEQDRLDLLLDAVFARALASSVCRTLKVDAGPVLDRLPVTGAYRLKGPSAGINTPFRPMVDSTGSSAWAKISKPVVLAGFALLLGALVLILLPSVKQGGAPFLRGVLPAADTALIDDSSAPVLLTSVHTGEANDAAAMILPLSGSLSSLAPVSEQTVTAAPTRVPPPENLEIPAGLAASTASPALQAASSANVTFRASGQSWVKVTDANGTVLLGRTLSRGDVAEASGVLPLAAVVGRADATQVQVRGKVFDLSAVSRDNVARFEVK